MERIIQIKAESKIYSVDECVPESKIIQRLIRIRNLFTNYKHKSHGKFPDDTLKVKTWVVNPELPLK